MLALNVPPSWPTQCFYAFARIGLGLAGVASECDEVTSDELSSSRY
jgi:hypothetical protein